MIHDKPQVQSDPHIVCQIDFVNAFQALNCQLDTNDCILGKASRTYGEENVQIGDELPHLPSLKPFFAYFRSMNQVASHNRFNLFNTSRAQKAANRATHLRCFGSV